MTSILIAVSGGSIAHTLRPLPIALRLRKLGARVLFGGRGPYMRFIAEQGFPVVPLPMLDYARVLRLMDSERFHLHGVSEYETAVCRQRGYLEDIRPDLVLQDGPDPSLPVATLEAGIEHVNLANATVWGLGGLQRVVPFRPWVRTAVSWSATLTRWANYLLILQRNIRINIPLYVYLAQHGIAYQTIQQSVLLPDLPELFGARADIPNGAFIGPLLYEPEVPFPSWWKELDESRPIVYVALGSSGGTSGMQTMIEALAKTDYQVVFSTADSFDAGQLPRNFFASRMVPREAVLRRAAVMVYHGGNATTYQGIRFGVPMVAIPAHFDHAMNAHAVVARGLGACIYPHELTAEGLRQAIEDVYYSSAVARSLKRFQLILARRNAAEEGANIVIDRARRATRRGQQVAVPSRHWIPASPAVFEEVACDLCGEISNQANRQIEDTLLEGRQSYTVVRCKSCGLFYCSPRPNQNSRWLFEALELRGDCAQFGSPKVGRMQHGKQLRAIRRLANLDLQSRVMIVGCGDGYFARYLLDRVGCETLCVEQHPALVRRARVRGLWVKEGPLEDQPQEDSDFDLILFIDSLEGTMSPRKTLASAQSRLAPGGRVVIRTVDSADPDAVIDVPRALFAFTSASLDATLRGAGFTGIRYLEGRRSKHLWCTAIPEEQ